MIGIFLDGLHFFLNIFENKIYFQVKFEVCSKLNVNVILTALSEIVPKFKRTHLKTLNLSNKFGKIMFAIRVHLVAQKPPQSHLPFDTRSKF